MKLRLPHKLQAALIATLASAALTTLSTGSTAQAATVTSPTADNIAGWFVHDTENDTWLYSDNYRGNVEQAVTSSFSFNEPGTETLMKFNISGVSGIVNNRGTYTFVFTVDLAKLQNVEANTILLTAGAGSTYVSGIGLSPERTVTESYQNTAKYSGWSFVQLGNTGYATVTLTEGNSGAYLTAYNGEGTRTQNRNGSGGLKDTNNVNTFYIADVLKDSIVSFAVWQTANTLEQADMDAAAAAIKALPQVATWAGTEGNHTWATTGVWVKNAAFASGADALFDSTASYKTVDVNSAITAGTVTVKDAYTFNVQGDGSLSVGSLAMAGGSIQKTGGGSLSIAGDSTITSTIQLQGGSLAITAGSVTVDAANKGNFTMVEGSEATYSNEGSGFMLQSEQYYLVQGQTGTTASVGGGVQLQGGQWVETQPGNSLLFTFTNPTPGTYYVNRNMTYADDMATATDFVIKNDTTLDVGSDGGTLTGTLRGKGTFAFTSALNNAATTQQLPGALALDNAEWQGIVQVNGGEMNVGESIQHLTTGDSWVELRGVSGRLGANSNNTNATYSGNVILTNADDGTSALRITTSNSGRPEQDHITTLTGSISGTGDIERRIGNGNNLTFAGDISGWTGTYYNGGKNGEVSTGWNVVSFTHGGEINANFINKAQTNACYLRLVYQADATVNGDIYAQPAQGKSTVVDVTVNANTTFTGTVNVNTLTVAQGKTATFTTAATAPTISTLTGTGTVVLDATKSTSAATTRSGWTGTVTLTGDASAARTFSNFTNGTNSTLELKGYKGWSSNWNGTNTENIKLTNPDGGVAWDATGAKTAYSGSTATYSGTWSGDGTMLIGPNLLDYVFSGDLSQWNGRLENRGSHSNACTFNLTFTDHASQINAEIAGINATPASGQQANAMTLVVDTAATFSKNVTANTLTINTDKSATLQGGGTFGSLTGAGALVVDSGSNSVAVTGAASGYTGAVTVTSGTLVLGNSLTTTGAVSVASGAGITFGNGASLAANSLSLEAGAKLDFSAYTGSIGSKVNVVTTTDGVTGYDGATITGPTAPRGMTTNVAQEGNDIVLTFQAKADATMHLYVLTGQSNSLGAVKGTPLPSGMLEAYQSGALLWNGNMHKDRPSGADTNRYIADPGWQVVAPQEPGLTINPGGYGNNPCMGPEYGFSYIMENKAWAAAWLGADSTLAVVKGSLDGGGNGYWLQDNKAYQTLLDNVKLSIQDAVALGYSNISLDGLMYLQGESNSLDDANIAGERFTNFIGYLKTDLQSWLTQNPELTGVTLAFDGNAVTGEPATWTADNKQDPTAKETVTANQFIALATQDGKINADRNGYGFVYTRDLAKITSGDTQNVHYRGTAQLTIGARYAYAFAVQNGVNVGTVRGQDDSATLDTGAAWWMETAPTAADVAVWDISSVSQSIPVPECNRIADGQTLTVGGIRIEDVYSPDATARGTGSVAITGGTLEIGNAELDGSGITLVEGDLSISSAVHAVANQTWQAAAGHKLAVNATTTISDGATLTLADNLYLTFGAITGAGNLAIGHVTFDMDMDYMLANGLGKYRSTETPDGENGYFTGNLDLVHLTGENSAITFTGEGGSIANITKAGELANYTLSLTNGGKALSITGLPLDTETYYARSGEVVYTSADDGEFGIYGASKVMLAGSVEAPATLKLVSGLKAGTVIDTSGLGGTVSFDSGMELAESSLGTLSSNLTLTGTGTFVMNAKSGDASWPLPTGVSLARGENGWKGIVRISGGNFKANDLDALANGLYSTIELNGVSGWTSHSNGTLALNLMLTDKENGTAAWDFNAGSSSGDYDNPKMTITGKVSGTGTLKKTNNNHESFAFSGDISEWTGKYQLTVGYKSRLTFLGDAHEVNIDTEKTNANGQISIAVGDGGTTAFSTRFTEQSNMQGVNEILVRANATAEFAGTISASEASTFNGNVTNSGTMTLNGLTMAANTTFTNTGTFTLGGAINIDASVGIVNNGPMVVTCASEQTLGGTLSGSGSLTKDGTGTLTVSGNNTGYKGNISVVGGTLKVGHNNALGTLSGARTLTIQTGGTLDVNGKEGNAANNFVVELAGGTLANSAAGSLSYGTRHFVTSVNVTDDSTIQADYMFGLTAGSYNPINVVFTDGTTLEKKGTADFVVTKATITGNGTFKVSEGTLRFQHPTTSSANFIMNGGSVAVGQQAAANYTLSRDIAITTTADSSFSLPLNTNAHAITYNGDANLAVSGAISGTGSLVKDGAGTLTLSGASTYTGGTTISAGTVATSNTNALGLSGVTIADGATLQVSGELNIGGTEANTYGVLNNGAGGTIALTDGSFLKLHAGSGSRTYNLGKVNVNGSASISEEWFDATVNIANINGGATDELALISNHSNSRGIWNIGTATGQAQNYTGTLILNDQDTNGNNNRAVNFNFKDGSMFKSASIKLRDGEYKTDRTGNPMENNIILAASEVSFGSVSDLPAQGEHTRPSVWTVKSNSDTETRTLVLDAESGSYTTKAGIDARVNIQKTGASEQTFTGSTANFNGNVDVEAGVLNIMKATSLNVQNVTLGTGAIMGVYNGENVQIDTNHEGKLTIKTDKVLTAGEGSTLNANLELATGSTLDVSATGGTGLHLGSALTINPGMQLSDADMRNVWDLEIGGMYKLVYGEKFDELVIQDVEGWTGTYSPGDLTAADKLDAHTFYNDLQENHYYVVFTNEGGNVGTYAIYCNVPEPTTGTLSLLALAALAARRRKHN